MNKLFWIWILSCAFHFSGTAQGLNNAILMHNTGNRQVVSVSTDVQENRYIVIKTINSDSVFVQKMDSLGTMLWQRFWVSSFSAERAEADASGLVYVSGSSTGSFDMDPGPGTSPSATSNAVAVVCLDPNGTFSWGRTTNVIPGFSGSCTLIDTEPIGGGILIYGNWFGRVDIDPSAAVFQPVSQISGSGGSFILRLDQAGNTININLVESSCCNEYQVAVAPNGKYAVAFTTGDSLAVYGQGVYSLYAYTLSNQNYCVVEFDQSGGLAWRSDLIDGGFSTNTQICYDQQSNLYIKGNEGIDTDLDPGPGFDDTTALLGGTCFLMKLDANRNREWIKMIETGFNYNTPGLFAINELNEIFLSGYGTNDGLTGSDIPESSPLSSPGLISIDPPVSTPGSDPDPYLVKLNTCAEIEWKRFGQMFRSEAAFNNAEDLVFCGVFGNNFDLDPDPVTIWFTPFSTVGENLMLLHFDKSGYCRPSPYNGTGSGVFIQEVKIKNFNTFLPNYVFRDTVVGFTGSSSYQESTVSGSYLSQGEYYYVWVTVAPSINSTVAAWFDTNGDLYYDANEAIGSYQTSVFGNTVSFTLYVPYVGTPVLSRLRIRNVCCDSQVDPCCNYDAGQTIDYLINTQPGVSDVAVEEIIPIPASSSPGVTGACPGYYNPVAVFRNIGTTTVTIFLGDLYVDSILLQPNPFSMTKGPGDVYYLTFGPAIYLEAGKSYAFFADCYASGDTIVSNDSMSFTFTMPDLPPYTVTPSAPCLQSPLSIGFQLPSGVSVNWYDGTTGPFVNVLADILPFKTVPFTMSDSLGCTFTDTIDVPVTPLPSTPSISYVYHQGAYYLLATSVSSVQFFSWLKNGVTHATTTNDSLPNPVPGSIYQLIIQDQISGCFSDTSLPFLFNPMGFDEVSHQVNLVSVLPNPFTDHLVIDFGEKGVQQDSQILLTDMQGRIVLPPDFLKSGTRVYRLETSGLSNGIYMLRLSGDRSNQTIRLVKGE